MRRGFTTGTAATAAAIACVLGNNHDKVNVKLPSGDYLSIDIVRKGGKVGVIKDAGDDPDVTDGIFIYADATFTDDGKIEIAGGEGVGIVTRVGLSIPVGSSAINPAPLNMIIENVAPLLNGRGVKITIHAENGQEIAEKTFNSRLGIVGGISIIGTTGIVEPMSSEAIIASIRCEIDILAAENTPSIWCVPGRIGERALLAELPNVKVVQMSNFVGDTLDYIRQKGYKRVGLAGHPGKLAKICMGVRDTHSSRSTQANEYVERLLGIDSINTLEEICVAEKLDRLAEEISIKAATDYGFESVNVLLFSMNGTLVGRYE
ncbi:MAG: cobalt-precorrin-5B (C(1))-methyltransferase CbiD [Deferribacteraceae bacterium]|nr:cobalt-precorrin-5B (C(1))-methyltransferase CbiD [Deferribacteraceae bacterium]